MFQTTNLSGFGSGAAGVACTPNTIVVVSGETLIGNMTQQGGLAKAFDGITAQDTANSAALSSGVGTAGVDWGSGVTKLIDKVEIWSCSDNGLDSSEPATLEVKLQGSTDNFSSSNVTLHTESVAANVVASTKLTLDPLDDATTAYRYHRIEFADGAGTTICAEITFYECA